MHVEPDFQEACDRLDSLARRLEGEMAAYFSPLVSDGLIGGTRTTVRCSTLLTDRRGPRVADLARKLKEYVVDFAMPRRKIAEALVAANRSRSTAPLLRLQGEAARLFTRLANSGEGGELLLYAMAERVLGIPQIMCKMPLKTSPEMHVQGSDGIHAAFDADTGGLALYWGESKLHKTPSGAIDSCFESLAPFLMPKGGTNAPHERDIQLLRDHIDLDDEHLERAILSYLNPDDAKFLRLDYRGLCLVGFDEDAYRHLPGEVAAFEKEITLGRERWRARIEDRVGEHKVGHVVIEILCMPLPSVGDFRAALLKELTGGG